MAVFPTGAPPVVEMARIFIPGLKPSFRYAGGMDHEVAEEEEKEEEEVFSEVKVESVFFIAPVSGPRSLLGFACVCIHISGCV
jgi:hypothetical protein